MHGNIIIFDGMQTDAYSMFITNAGIYETPKPEYDSVYVEGRNGALLIEQNMFKNVNVRYPFVIYNNFQKNIKELKSFLNSKTGYKRLEDSFEPNRFRVARFGNIASPKYSYIRDMGTGAIEFDCKPQWFLKNGEKWYTVSGNTLDIYNPTNFPSKPLYKIGGQGQFSVGGCTVTVSREDSDEFYIDCELMDSYTASGVNMNSAVRRTSGWPMLNPGNNRITTSGNINVQVQPRWYEI